MPQFGLGYDIGPSRFNQSNEYAVVGASGGSPASYANCVAPLCNISAFAAPAPFTPGNAGRNILTGPASYYSMLSAKKNFRITERINLQFRYDFQNPFHNFGFSAPVAIGGLQESAVVREDHFRRRDCQPNWRAADEPDATS